MGLFKNLFSKGSPTPKASESKVSQPSDIDMSPKLVSGIAMIYQIPNATGKERESLESQAQNLYGQLNPEFSESLDRVGFRKACLTAFVESKEKAMEIAMQPSLNVIIQYRGLMLPGVTAKPFDCYAVTWLTKPTDGKPAVWVTGDGKVIPERN
jgi:hypothetical protein